MESRQRFIAAWGWVFVGGSLFFLLGSLVTSIHENQPILEERFFAVIGLCHLVAGVGVLRRQMWGYYLLKFYLYLGLVAFPIGTAISYFSLRYMKRNRVRDIFAHLTEG